MYTAKHTSRSICHFIFKTLLKIKSRKSPLPSAHLQQEVVTDMAGKAAASNRH